MSSFQRNVDQFFDLNEDGIEDAKITIAYPSIILEFNALRKEGENPVLYLRKYGNKSSLGIKPVKRINSLSSSAKQIVEDQGQLTLEHDGVVTSYSFNPLDILPYLIDENITTEDLYPLFKTGFFRNVCFTREILNNEIKRTYFMARNQHKWLSADRQKQLSELNTEYNFMSMFNPRRIYVGRQIAQLEEEIQYNVMDTYLNLNRENTPIEEKDLPFLGRILGLFLSHSAGAQTATYEHNDLRRQNDWFDLLENQAVLVIDGTGHGDWKWQDVEAPIYRKILVPRFNRFLVSNDQLEYTEDRVNEYNKKWEEEVYIPFSKQYTAILDERKVSNQKERVIFRDKFTRLIDLVGPREFTGEFSGEFDNELNELFELIDFPSLREELISIIPKNSQDEIYKTLSLIVENSQALKAIYTRLFEQLASSDDPKLAEGVKSVFERGIKLDSTSATKGSAMNLVIPFHAVDMHYVITFVIADTCTIFFEPTDDYSSLQLKGNMFQTGGELGDMIYNFSTKQHDAVQMWRMSRGGAYISFTDGIGEFLSVETISGIFIENYQKGPEELLTLFTEAIYDKVDFNESRYQAAANPIRKTKVKEYNPDLRSNIDDICFAYGFIRPALIK